MTVPPSWAILAPLALGWIAAPSLSAAVDPGLALEAAMRETQADIERDTEALIRLRADIAAERDPLAARLERLRKDVLARRSEVDRIRRVRREGEEAQLLLESETGALEQECRFLQSLFSEYLRAMETRVTAAEAPLLTEPLRTLDRGFSDERGFTGLSEEANRLLTLSADWNRTRRGGHAFEGGALDAGGIEHRGRFAAFGPIAYFAAEKGSPAGLAVTQSGSVQPSIYDQLPLASRTHIVRLVEGATAVVPIDVTAGDAIKVAEARVSLVEHARKGGFVMIPLLALGAAAATLATWKSIELAGIRVRAGHPLRAILDRLASEDVDGARQLAGQLKEPLASLVAEGIAHRHAPRDHLEHILHEHVLGTLPRLERHLGTLAVFGGVAPLLGLLGTVTGMIHTFQLVTVFGSGNAKLLSGGISEALVTTEFGLVIAIPVLLIHAFLARRVRTIVGSLEQTSVSMVNDLKVRYG
jgi:biopolymer transport protein ExbB